MSSATATPVDNNQYEALLRRLDKLEQTMDRVVALLERTQPAALPWKHLEPRKHPWRRQLYVKGRNMTARQAVGKYYANHWTVEEAARNLELPVEAIRELLEYTEKEKSLLEYEAMYEQHLVQKRGYDFAPDSPLVVLSR